MPWLALEIEVDAANAEAMAEALLERGADSVSAEDAEAGSAQESPLYGEPELQRAAAWRRNRMTVLVAQGTDAAALIGEASSAAGISPPPRARASIIEDDDWVRRTQSQFAPIRVGDRLWVVPHWCLPPQDDRAVVIRLDPGLAFGTGSHTSTRLALAWLERVLRGGERVLDYGCGSGILALAAAKLGASAVTAVDLDSQAIQAAAANARANGVALQTAMPDALPPGQFDVIVANILAGPLAGLEPEFAARAHTGARIALSGILVSQAADVTAVYAPRFDLKTESNDGDWVLLSGVRR
ncbi:MAG: ribosomal protein L11 methyltransferase [Betaproteobacteria bacterium RIFCSPLOWO2_02_FULL_66_14]|nr:MAG: ribosomal protein L11 methyltransferase [Betaproteobacteria bacterium RIFCSPLOWO2_02_FULL_66_14]